jgi:DNA-directed RNA polymerase subunit RPC12/RpoP
MTKKYFLKENNRRTGPFTCEQLEKRYRAAEINGDTLCWPDQFFSIGAKPLRTFFPHFYSPKFARDFARLQEAKRQKANQERQDRDQEKRERERQDRERKEQEHQEQLRQERGKRDKERQERPYSDREQQEREREEQKRKEHQKIRTVTIECVDCGTALRLRLQQSDAVYRCPSCKTEYKTIRSDGEPPVFLVVPDSRQRTPPSDKSAKKRKQISPEVRSALAIFALDEDANFDHVRQAYRVHVKQYHPP